jgi:hypothetical protein
MAAEKAATIADIRRLAETADAEGLRRCVNILCDRLEEIDLHAKSNRSAVENMQREIRRMSEVVRRGS